MEIALRHDDVPGFNVRDDDKRFTMVRVAADSHKKNHGKIVPHDIYLETTLAAPPVRYYTPL